MRIPVLRYLDIITPLEKTAGPDDNVENQRKTDALFV